MIEKTSASSRAAEAMKLLIVTFALAQRGTVHSLSLSTYP
jgi:hypothetical protein